MIASRKAWWTCGCLCWIWLASLNRGLPEEGLSNGHAFARLLQQCRLHCRPATTGEQPARAYFKAYPYELQEFSLPATGQSLLQTVANQDALARVVDQQLWKTAHLPVSDEEDGSRQPFFWSSQANSDGILIARDRTIVAFPRFLLLSPTFQLIEIQPGDLVAAFRSQYKLDTDPGKKAKQADPIWSFLFSRQPQSEFVQLQLSAPTATAEQISQFEKRVQASNANWDGVLEEAQTIFATDRTEHQLTYVVSRNHGGTTLHFIIPFRGSSSLGQEGQWFAPTIAGSPEVIPWREATGGFTEQDFYLFDGDRISVVPEHRVLSLVGF